MKVSTFKKIQNSTFIKYKSSQLDINNIKDRNIVKSKNALTCNWKKKTK